MHMADPSFVSEPSNDVIADIDDGHSPATRNIARLMAVFILPSIFLILVALGGFLFLRQHMQPQAGHAAPTTVAASAPVAPADKDAQIAALQGQVVALQGQLLNRQTTPAATATGSAPVYAAESAAFAQMSARLDRIEANQRALAHAASAAAAAEAMQGAADAGAPFSTELALVQSQLANPHVLDAVRPFADKGVPSKVTLAAQFPHYAATANIAAKAATGGKGPLAKLSRFFGSFISVRRTDAAPNGQGVEATLVHAETSINAGDLAGAVTYLNALPAPAQTAIKPWLDQARARVALDAATRQISNAALGTLGQANGDAAGGAL
jgi:hypothetical protein